MIEAHPYIFAGLLSASTFAVGVIVGATIAAYRRLKEEDDDRLLDLSDGELWKRR